MNEVFTTKNVAFDVPGLDAAKGDLVWQVAFEMREWGIKDINITVPDQEVILTCEIDGNQDQTRTIFIKDVEIDRQISSSGEAVCPSEAFVDSQGRVTVEF